MKKLSSIIVLLLVLTVALGAFVACEKPVDIVAELQLDFNSNTKKAEATVKTYIDGDTTHFNVDKSVSSTGVLKARYIAINTPESTGVIEEFGKAAAAFTRSKLESAVSIYLESDDNKWNIDSTGSRYVVWVWYQPSEGAEYRNLNLEIMQEGLAIPSNMEGNRYGDYCVRANKQAQDFKLKVYSNEKDNDFWYGDAVVTTIKDIRLDPSSFVGTKVCVKGTVVIHNNNGMYIQEYDETTGLNFGFYCYYGYNLDSYELNLLASGNYIQLVGSVQYYEAGDSYQIAGLDFNPLASADDKNVTRLIEEGRTISYPLVSANDFNTKKITLDIDGEQAEKEMRALSLNTAVSLKNLYVYDQYTTTNEASASKGAMTLYCVDENGNKITLRTVVLREKDAFGTYETITYERYLNKWVDAQGIIDYYKSGSDSDEYEDESGYQIKIISSKALVVLDEQPAPPANVPSKH